MTFRKSTFMMFKFRVLNSYPTFWFPDLDLCCASSVRPPQSHFDVFWVQGVHCSDVRDPFPLTWLCIVHCSGPWVNHGRVLTGTVTPAASLRWCHVLWGQVWMWWQRSGVCPTCTQHLVLEPTAPGTADSICIFSNMKWRSCPSFISVAVVKGSGRGRGLLFQSVT